MNNELVEKCIKNAIDRVEVRRNRMGCYSYIKYFCYRNYLTVEEELYIREQVGKYIDENAEKIFNINFTINGIAC